MYGNQIKATKAALDLIRKLPPGLVWSLSVTNDDDPSAPSALNLFVSRAEWKALAAKLNFPEKKRRPEPGFISYYQNALQVSFIDDSEETEDE